MEKELEFLREQGVDSGLIDGVEEFRSKYYVAEEAKGRVICPDMPFYGREVLEMGIAALLEGENLLLTGPKATGKICWRRIWPGSSAGRYTMFLFMLILTAVI